MAPEYGATVGFSPSMRDARATCASRAAASITSPRRGVRKEQGLFRTDDTPDPAFTDTLELNSATVEPALAGPKRPQDRVPLKLAKQMYPAALRTDLEKIGTLSGVAGEEGDGDA